VIEILVKNEKLYFTINFSSFGKNDDDSFYINSFYAINMLKLNEGDEVRRLFNFYLSHNF
jgi:hypothetical protein